MFSIKLRKNTGNMSVQKLIHHFISSIFKPKILPIIISRYPKVWRMSLRCTVVSSGKTAFNNGVLGFFFASMANNHAYGTSVIDGMVDSDMKLDNKVVIVTGSNSGIGYETALDLAKRNARVVMACRDLDKGGKAKNKIEDQVPGANVALMKLDLASLASVHEFVGEFLENESRLDILVNNAGIMACPQWKTENGFEMQFGVNHIGHFLLTKLLLDLLKKSAPSRIVIVSSAYYKRARMNWDELMQPTSYDPFKAYALSKLSNILHCHELSKRLKGTGVTCNVLHPGIIRTDLGRHIVRGSHLSLLQRIAFYIFAPLFWLFFMKTPARGSQTSIYCAIAPELENVSGKYFGNCTEEELLPHATNEKDAETLWKLSEEWINKKSN